ncbi:MAG: DUF4173 domain-containing protein [Deltaproteobacteria bacterium]|nr:DUF4173 domain-containing protein [Deltaproteobacteria bacterium]
MESVDTAERGAPAVSPPIPARAPHPAAPDPSGGPTLWLGAPPYRSAPAVVPPPPRPPVAKPAPFRAKELAMAVAIAIACDLALWGKGSFVAGGFGLAVLFVALPAAMAIAARKVRLSIRAALAAAMLAAIAARCAFDPTTGTVLSGLGLVTFFGLSLRVRRAFVPEAVASFFAGIGKVPSRVGAAVAGATRLAAKTRLGKVSLLPIVIPLALSVVFAGVFALANPVVAHGLGVALTTITEVVGLPHPARVFLWAIALVGACGLLRPACRTATGNEGIVGEGESTSTSLLVARNALAALNVLFLGYNLIDATYLWAGRPPAGTTTQHYAHQGTFWLTIALLMLTGVVGVMFREKTSLAHDPRAKTSRTLAYAWMAQGLVLALGTYRRIAMHIQHSGLSDLRIVGILGTTLVVAGVVTVAIKLHRRRSFTWLLRRQLDAFAVTTMLYVVAPTHLLASKVNVARIESGEYGPVLHVFRQGSHTESAAQLVPLLDHRDVRVRQGVAAILEQKRGRLGKEVNEEGTWRERDLASRRALAALDAAAPRIAEVLGSVSRGAAKESLLQVSRVANEGRSIEELLSVPTAEALEHEGYVEGRRDAL